VESHLALLRLDTDRRTSWIEPQTVTITRCDLRKCRGGFIVRAPVFVRTTAMRRFLPAACLSLTCISASAALPDYLTFQLQVRSNVGIGAGFNITPGAGLSDTAPDLNDALRVAARARFPSGQPGDDFDRHVWSGSNGTGFLVSEGPTGSEISAPRLDPLNRIWFAASGGIQPGIWRYDAPATTLFTNEPSLATGFQHARGNAAGAAGYRAQFTLGRAWVSFVGVEFNFHAREVGLDFQSPYAALFPPAFDENRVIAGKLTLAASGFHQIRTIDHRGDFVILARTSAEQAGSPYLSFDDQVGISPTSGRVVFVAGLAGGARGVFLANGPSNIVEIARTGTQGLTAIASLAPVVNDDGLVAFIGTDGSARESVFIGDDTGIRRVIGRTDLVPVDLAPGSARIAPPQAGQPPLLGGLAINGDGDLAFLATLTTPDGQSILGRGVYVARAGTQLIHASGFE